MCIFGNPPLRPGGGRGIILQNKNPCFAIIKRYIYIFVFIRVSLRFMMEYQEENIQLAWVRLGWGSARIGRISTHSA